MSSGFRRILSSVSRSAVKSKYGILDPRVYRIAFLVLPMVAASVRGSAVWSHAGFVGVWALRCLFELKCQ